MADKSLRRGSRQAAGRVSQCFSNGCGGTRDVKFNYCGLIERGAQRGWTPGERERGENVFIQREEEQSTGEMEGWEEMDRWS